MSENKKPVFVSEYILSTAENFFHNLQNQSIEDFDKFISLKDEMIHIIAFLSLYIEDQKNHSELSTFFLEINTFDNFMKLFLELPLNHSIKLIYEKNFHQKFSAFENRKNIQEECFDNIIKCIKETNDFFEQFGEDSKTVKKIDNTSVYTPDANDLIILKDIAENS